MESSEAAASRKPTSAANVRDRSRTPSSISSSVHPPVSLSDGGVEPLSSTNPGRLADLSSATAPSEDLSRMLSSTMSPTARREMLRMQFQQLESTADNNAAFLKFAERVTQKRRALEKENKTLRAEIDRLKQQTTATTDPSAVGTRISGGSSGSGSELSSTPPLRPSDEGGRLPSSIRRLFIRLNIEPLPTEVDQAVSILQAKIDVNKQNRREAGLSQSQLAKLSKALSRLARKAKMNSSAPPLDLASGSTNPTSVCETLLIWTNGLNAGEEDPGIPENSPSFNSEPTGARISTGSSSTNISSSNVTPTAQQARASTLSPPPVPVMEASGQVIDVSGLRAAFGRLREELTCPICFELFNDDSVTLSSCGHSFCRRCLMSVQSGNCPTCRGPFPPVPRSTFKSSRSLSAAVERLCELHRLICPALGENPVERRRQPPDYVPDSTPTFF